MAQNQEGAPASEAGQAAGKAAVQASSAEAAAANASGSAPSTDAAVAPVAPATAAERVANPQPHPDFDAFVATISALRAPDGCPWDREQTHGSIAHNMIEEAYEAVDAIEQGKTAHLREELGDVLLQVVLQSQIAADAGEFTIDDVCADVNAKMIRRHPHVFGNLSAEDASAVLGLWDQVKMAEKEAADTAAEAAGEAREGLLDGVPTSFPALMQAQKISRKAVAAGFEWDSLQAVWAQVAEEVAELKAAYEAAPKGSKGKVSVNGQLPEGAAAGTGSDAGWGASSGSGMSSDPAMGTALGSGAEMSLGAGLGEGSSMHPGSDGPAATPEQLVAAVEMEFGDVLFSLVNVARKMGIDAEDALRASCGKFRRRWAYMERAAWDAGTTVEDLPTPEQEQLWQQAKLEG